MRTQRVKIYKFDELSEEAKKVAINSFRDFNVDHDWWNFTYEDAAQIGLKITEFDIYQGSCKGEFLEYAHAVAEKIKENHGEQTETYKTAVNYLVKLAEVMEKFKDDDDYELIIETEAEEFLKSLCKNYLKILSGEYEYLTGDEAVIESIRSNEYEFTANGKQWYM